MDLSAPTAFTIVYLPLIKGFFSDFQFLKKAKRASVGGYIYSIFLPSFFTYVALQTLFVFRSLLGSARLFFVFSLITATTASVLSGKFFNYRVFKLKLGKNTEAWVVNKFYRNILYSLLLAAPGVLRFFFLHLLR